jgi:hypothetical protein
MTRTIEICRCLRIVGFLAILGAGRIAGADSEPSHYQYEYSPPAPMHHPVPPYPPEMGFSQHHSSTAYEGAQRGDAVKIQAKGNYLLHQSQAAILFEQAEALNRENELLKTDALHAQQRMWRDAIEEVRYHHEARVAEGRSKLAARRLTVHRAAYRLSPIEFNTISGRISWPVVLQAAKYGRSRARLEELFRQHVGYGDPQPGTAQEIARCSDELIRGLRKDIGIVPRDEYLAAQKFLRGLKFEVTV